MKRNETDLLTGPEGHSGFHALISDLLSRFLNAPEDGLDSEIEDAIRRVASFLGLDQGLLVQWGEGGNGPLPTHSWTAAGGLPAPLSRGTDVVPWSHRQSTLGNIVIFSRVDDLPDEARRDKEFFRASGRKSLISLPLKVGGKIIGALVLASLSGEVIWEDEVVRQLQLISDVFASALERRKNKLELSERLQFEMLLAETSSRLINLPADRLNDEILNILRCVCERLDIDSSTLWLSDNGTGIMQLEYFYDRKERPVPRRLIGRQLFPWATDKILAGDVLVISRLSDLPPEAIRDSETWRLFGAKSCLVIPLSTGGSVFGAVSFAVLRVEREWREPVVSRLGLVTQIFASALARQFQSVGRDIMERKKAEEEIARAYAEIKNLKERLEAENVYLREQINMPGEFENIIGRSDAMKFVFFRVQKVAPMDTTVLITGETGSGKGVIARAIHQASRRRDRPMVIVNCAALPESLVESELFGREKGAFTGACSGQMGRFDLAHKGTLFLDEVGELTLELQAKLLRVIDLGEFERLGSPRTIKVDVRIIASTNRDLRNEIRAGRFRQDLFYRLNVFPVSMPPLNQRKEDIPLLVEFFVQKHARRAGKHITVVPRTVMKTLQEFEWPGNVRELENVIERAVIATENNVLHLAECIFVPLPVRMKDAAEDVPLCAPGSRRDAGVARLADAEKDHILAVLADKLWRIGGPGGAAEALGLHPSTLRSRMKWLGIRKTKEI